jgi:hypothetical protein
MERFKEDSLSAGSESTSRDQLNGEAILLKLSSGELTVGELKARYAVIERQEYIKKYGDFKEWLNAQPYERIQKRKLLRDFKNRRGIGYNKETKEETASRIAEEKIKGGH